jgi:septal ring factor EnvC (AmiA/AmiB activator)
MKNLLQNLLIFFALGLCVLLAVQWHRESVLRQQLQRSDKTTRSVSETIDSLQSDVSRLEAEITRIDGLRQQLTTNVIAREAEAARLKAEVESLGAALTKANQNITVQNDALKKLASERDGAVQRYNQLAVDYNALVERWNAQQQALTNAVRALR